MSRYKVIIKEEAQEDLKKLLHSEPKIYKKAMKFIGELYEHPKTGLGHPEPLNHGSVLLTIFPMSHNFCITPNETPVSLES